MAEERAEEEIGEEERHEFMMSTNQTESVMNTSNNQQEIIETRKPAVKTILPRPQSTVQND